MEDELKKTILNFGLIDRTLKNAKANIDAFVSKENEKAVSCGISSSESIQYDLDMCSYNISNFGQDAERHCIELRINYYCKNKYVGYYSALYDPKNAEIIDDYTVIDL